MAQGANLIFFIPTCITSIIVNWKNKNINWKLAIPVIISGIIGAVLGAKISVKMPIQNLKMLFGIFLLIIAIHEIYSLKNEYRNYKKTNNNNYKKNENK